MDKEISQKTWGNSPAGTTFASGLEAGTKDFFEAVLKKRKEYEQPWLGELVKFDSFNGKKVLEVGFGAGYDAFEFLKAGAQYYGVDITPENRERALKHLHYYSLNPKILVTGDAENLGFEDQLFDLYYSNGVLHHTPDIKKSLHEAHRVLSHTGKIILLLYHKYSVFYFLTVIFTNHLLKLKFTKQSLKETLGEIEYNTAGLKPLVNVYSKKEISQIFKEEGFEVLHINIRKLTREDLPPLPPYKLFKTLYSFIPDSLLNFFSEKFGWYLIIEGKKTN